MDIITTSLEALIQRATNVNNQGPDTAANDAFCGLVNKEPECAQMAAKFITAKVHSLQEWEALQALLLLETCMKRCGPLFHSEVGKFRFLNELIKLVSPKYMGAHTPEPVRRRVLELMYSWTIQYPKETKIKDAFDMLKKQGVVKEEPQLSARERHSRDQPSILQDEEKSQLLQKLLQSKNPDDLQAANRLIKSMVKEDERRVDEKWRHAAELERAVNNCRLLREMLENWDSVSGNKEDLDLIRELHSACLQLSPILFRLASAPGDPAFIQSVLAANDELGEVFAKYNTAMKTGPVAVSQFDDNASSLLDLTPSPPPVLNRSSYVDDTSNHLSELGFELGIPESGNTTANGDGAILSSGVSSHRNLLDDIFGSPSPSAAPIVFGTATPLSSKPNRIEKNVPSVKENVKSRGLEELDLLGKSLLQETLSQSKTAQNNKYVPKPVKVSMNEMSLLASTEASVSGASGSMSSLLLDTDLLLGLEPESDNTRSLESTTISKPSPPSVVPEAPSEHPPPSVNSELQVLPLGDIMVTLDSVKPSSVPPFAALEERNGISVAIFLAKDCPRPDVSVFVVTTSSKNQSPLTNFLFQPVVPKYCRLRLVPASSSTLPAHNPFLPPSAITQIMLIASPNKDPIQLKFVVSYIMEDETFTELGEISQLPLI